MGDIIEKGGLVICFEIPARFLFFFMLWCCTSYAYAYAFTFSLSGTKVSGTTAAKALACFVEKATALSLLK